MHVARPSRRPRKHITLLSPFLLLLGLLQLWVAYRKLSGVSLTGPRRRLGYLVGIVVLAAGGCLMPATAWVLVTTVPAGLLALATLVAVGSLSGRRLDTAHFLRPGDWPEGRCRAVRIPNGEKVIPGLFLIPPRPAGAAVCLVHGSGDNKTAFKWRLIGALLDRELTVLTIDLAGHGENRTPQRWPDCTTEIPAALNWLREQPGIQRIGLLGISMGAALGARAAVTARPDALALCEAPVSFQYSRSVVRHEIWNLLHSPVLDVMGDITTWQFWHIWHGPRGRREIALPDLIERLDMLHQVGQLSCPLHLVYGQRDEIAPPEHGRRLLQQAGGCAQLTIIPGASHLSLTLLPATTGLLADWFARHLEGCQPAGSAQRRDTGRQVSEDPWRPAF
jgi:pimeloyl-ACP methyl ester carboxylesterase